MQHIPAGFFPDKWNQTFAAFKRLVEHLDAMQFVLGECSILSSENCDVSYIREQVTREVDTLEFMASDAANHWKALGVEVSSAAGRLSLNRPADDVAWCSVVLNAAWHLHNGLQRELSGQNAELCVQRLPLHLGRIPNDIGQWRERITAEIRAGILCSNEPGKPEDQTSWTSDLIAKGKRIIADTAGIKSKQFARAMTMSDAEGGELYRNLTGKPKQSRRTN